MLPAAARLRAAGDFAAVVRSGRRGPARHLVVHLLASQQPTPARAGFVVSAKVGNSVVRHRVTRRLRPLVRYRLAALPPGTDLVVRALPSAAGTSSAELAADLDSGIRMAARRAGIAVRGIAVSASAVSANAAHENDLPGSNVPAKKFVTAAAPSGEAR